MLFVSEFKAKPNFGILVPFLAIFLVLSLVGCAPKQTNTVQSASNDSSIEKDTIDWSLKSDCKSCHAIFVTVTGHESCVSCHDQEDALTKIHNEASAATFEAKGSLSKSCEVNNEKCLACHNLADLSKNTKDMLALVDGNGTIINPHELPDEHLGNSVVCTDCHEIHSSSYVKEDVDGICLSCHHDGVYECYTCHE